MLNTIVGAGSIGAGAELRYGSGSATLVISNEILVIFWDSVVEKKQEHFKN
jgi:hypothetical protein